MLIGGTVKILGPYYNTGPHLGDPKRDHNFDDSPLRERFCDSTLHPSRNLRVPCAAMEIDNRNQA